MPLLFAIAVLAAVLAILVLLGVGAELKGVDSRTGLGDENRFPEHHNFIGGSF